MPYSLKDPRLTYILVGVGGAIGLYLCVQGYLLPSVWPFLFFDPTENTDDRLRLFGGVLLLLSIAVLVVLRTPPTPSAPTPLPRRPWLRQRFTTLMNRVAWASLLNLVYWLAVIEYPAHDVSLPLVRVLTFINFPVALFGLLLPQHLRAIDVFFLSFRHGTYFCFGIPRFLLWQHLLTSVPIYVLLFYSPALIRWLVRRARTSAA